MAKDPVIESAKLLEALDFAAETAAREDEYRDRFVAFVRSLLDVVDSVDRAVAGSAGASEGSVPLKTVQLIARQLEAALARAGVTPTACLGEPVDPARHEVTAVRDTLDTAEETIVEVVTRGYEWNGLVVRRPRVIVAHHPKEEA